MKNVLLFLAAGVVLHVSHEPRRLDIEFLFLDTTECTRCIDTGARLEQALDLLRPVLSETGWEARITRTQVTSEDQARTLRFASSPTVRINGIDIQLDSRESVCGDCGKLCKDANVTCREWRYHDEWFTSPPKGLFVEAILKSMHQPESKPAADSPRFEVPENLKRFFATKKTAAKASCCSRGSESANEGGCCESRRSEESSGCCSLSPESRADRKRLLDELKAQVVERRNLPTGTSMRFKARLGLAARLGQVIELERECCQFLTFVVRAESKTDSIWLDVTGSADTKATIEEYFGKD